MKKFADWLVEFLKVLGMAIGGGVYVCAFITGLFIVDVYWAGYVTFADGWIENQLLEGPIAYVVFLVRIWVLIIFYLWAAYGKRSQWQKYAPIIGASTAISTLVMWGLIHFVTQPEYAWAPMGKIILSMPLEANLVYIVLVATITMRVYTFVSGWLLIYRLEGTGVKGLLKKRWVKIMILVLLILTAIYLAFFKAESSKSRGLGREIMIEETIVSNIVVPQASLPPMLIKSEPYCFRHIAVIFPSGAIVVLKGSTQTFGESIEYYRAYFSLLYNTSTVQLEKIVPVGYEAFRKDGHVVENDGGLYFDGTLCVPAASIAQ